MDKCLVKVIISLCFLTLISTIAFIGIESEVVGKTPCVDGLNRVNLEGIMCEEIEETWFGYHPSLMLLLFIPMIPIIIWLVRE